MKKKITTSQLVICASLLALCIVSQYFKNLSVFITGPIINACIILAVLFVGLSGAIIISVITPITAFLLTGSPIMAGIPLMFPAIMIGNSLLAVFTWLFTKKFKFHFHIETGMIIGSVCKAAFMGISIVLVLFPLFSQNIILPNGNVMPAPVLNTAKLTFSVYQFITALLGSIYASVLRVPLKKVTDHTNN